MLHVNLFVHLKGLISLDWVRLGESLSVWNWVPSKSPVVTGGRNALPGHSSQVYGIFDFIKEVDSGEQQTIWGKRVKTCDKDLKTESNPGIGFSFFIEL